MQLIDKAYRDVRYEREYKINPEEVNALLLKAGRLLELVKKLLDARLEALSLLGNFPTKKNHLNLLNNSIESSTTKEKDLNKVRERLKRYTHSKLYKISEDADKFYYRNELLISGPADNLYTIAGILKVCIIALNYADGSYSRLITQPHINIQTTLEHIYQLLPYEELHCLEDILNEYPDLIENMKS